MYRESHSWLTTGENHAYLAFTKGSVEVLKIVSSVVDYGCMRSPASNRTCCTHEGGRLQIADTGETRMLYSTETSNLKTEIVLPFSNSALNFTITM